MNFYETNGGYNRVEDEMEDVTPMFHVDVKKINRLQASWGKEFNPTEEKDLMDLQEQEAKEHEYGYWK